MDANIEGAADAGSDVAENDIDDITKDDELGTVDICDDDVALENDGADVEDAAEEADDGRTAVTLDLNALKAQLPPQVLKASPAQTTLQLEESSAWPPPFSKELPPIRAKDSH